jgi:hypothetical protein
MKLLVRHAPVKKVGNEGRLARFPQAGKERAGAVSQVAVPDPLCFWVSVRSQRGAVDRAGGVSGPPASADGGPHCLSGGKKLEDNGDLA